MHSVYHGLIHEGFENSLDEDLHQMKVKVIINDTKLNYESFNLKN